MKITLFALFAGLLMLDGFGYGSAEDKPDLSNTSPPKDIIKSAVEWAKLEDRNGYKYLPNTEKPYSGWAKETYDNGQVKSLTQFKEGNVVLLTSWHENGYKKNGGGVPAVCEELAKITFSLWRDRGPYGRCVLRGRGLRDHRRGHRCRHTRGSRRWGSRPCLR